MEEEIIEYESLYQRIKEDALIYIIITIGLIIFFTTLASSGKLIIFKSSNYSLINTIIEATFMIILFNAITLFWNFLFKRYIFKFDSNKISFFCSRNYPILVALNYSEIDYFCINSNVLEIREKKRRILFSYNIDYKFLSELQLKKVRSILLEKGITERIIIKNHS
ncbi:MAG: hypothetical protein KC589_00375 [Nanoarchaeota archaeon]|nr:hypothetical protein [Nanoarchaeota archaeon]